MHQIYYGVTWIQWHIFLRDGIPKSLGQVWNCSKEKIMQCWNPKFEKIKVWQRWSDSRLKWMECVLDLILSICIPYYQEGCNIDYLTRSKVLIGHPSENPERKPLRTNFVLPGWSSVNLVDQVSHLNLGLGSSGPNRSNRSGGPV